MAITLTTVVKETGAGGGTPTRAGRPATQARGLRGAMFSLPYIGPILSKASAGSPDDTLATHSITIAAGGVDDSTGFREVDAYDNSGGTAEAGTGHLDPVVVTRPNPGAVPTLARVVKAYIGKGVQGGSSQSSGTTSTPAGGVFDTTGRATDTGVDRFGRALGVANVGGGLGRYTYTNFDGRSRKDSDGGLAAGAGGRGTSTSEETVTVQKPGPAPTFGAVASGVIALADLTGAAGFSVNLDATDVTGGANSRKGAELVCFVRNTDTDEDGALVGYVVADGTTGASGAFPGSAARAGQTLAVYARFLGPGITAPGNSGTPAGIDSRVRSSSAWSARGTVTLT